MAVATPCVRKIKIKCLQIDFLNCRNCDWPIFTTLSIKRGTIKNTNGFYHFERFVFLDKYKTIFIFNWWDMRTRHGKTGHRQHTLLTVNWQFTGSKEVCLCAGVPGLANLGCKFAARRCAGSLAAAECAAAVQISAQLCSVRRAGPGWRGTTCKFPAALQSLRGFPGRARRRVSQPRTARRAIAECGPRRAADIRKVQWPRRSCAILRTFRRPAPRTVMWWLWCGVTGVLRPSSG